jgi:hypothetical protein
MPMLLNPSMKTLARLATFLVAGLAAPLIEPDRHRRPR